MFLNRELNVEDLQTHPGGKTTLNSNTNFQRVDDTLPNLNTKLERDRAHMSPHIQYELTTTALQVWRASFDRKQ